MKRWCILEDSFNEWRKRLREIEEAAERLEVERKELIEALEAQGQPLQ